MCKKRICSISLVLVLGLALPSVTTAKLVGWWKLDENSGTTAYDSSGNGHHGTLIGEPQWVSGKIGTALEFDGVEDYVDIGLGAGNYFSTLNSGLTVTAWINRATTGTYDVIFGSGRNPVGTSRGQDNNGWKFGVDKSDVLKFTTLGILDYTSSIQIPTGEWIHVAATFNDAGTEVEYYLNGNLEEKISGNGPANPATGLFAIGFGATLILEFFDGQLDDVRVYNHVLGEVEILAAMEGGGGYPYASNPSPEDESMTESTIVPLKWIAGAYAARHMVYFSDSFADVNERRVGALQCETTSTMCWVGQPPDPPLVHGKTYYWAADEVNDTSEPYLWSGEVWSFTTVEPPTVEPPSTEAPCEGFGYDGDIDGDCYVDWKDIAILASDWLQAGSDLSADIDQSGDVDLSDFVYIGWDWLSYVYTYWGSIMVVSAHPDDEGIFFGGALPYYTQVLGVPTVHISMTSGDWGRPPEVREAELTNADTIYFGRSVTTSIGLPPNPSADLFFPRFKDAPTSTVDQTWDLWNDGVPDNGDAAAGKQKAIETIATYIRMIQPDVIITHDFDGEYGHSNHKATAIAVAEAYDLAANSNFIDGNNPWQAKKLYIHQSESNGLGTSGRIFEGGWLFHDYWEQVSIDSNYDGIADLTPRQVADLGLDEHVTQGRPDVSTVYRSGENFDGHHSEWWGLYRTEVGPDTIAYPFTIMGKAYNDGSNNDWARGDFLQNVGLVRVR